MIGLPADLLSLLYLAVAGYTLWQLPGRWRTLTDADYTDDDRNLAGRTGFLLLTPIGVLVHELAHMAAASALGGRDIELHFRAYWGYVQYSGNLGAVSTWVVAAAGPAASLALGLAVGYGVLRMRQPWRDIGMAFAHATLLLDLLLYPGMSLIDGVGDFRVIYHAQTPTLAAVAGIVHAGGLIAYIVLARLQSRRTRQEARLALTERFAGQQVTLRSEVVERLALLESAARVRRLEPAEREELNHLQELHAWSVEHNQQLPPASRASSAPDASPEPGPTPTPGPRPPMHGPMIPGFPPPPEDERRN